MTTLGSLVGFALVFLLLSWGLSALGYLLLRLVKRPMQRAGCKVERTIAGLALFVPPLLGGAVTLLLMAHSLAARWHAEGDHCLRHLQHPHLCLRHGGGWVHEAWAVLIVAWAFSFGILEAARRGRAALRAMRTLQKLEAAGKLQPACGVPLLHIPSATPFCMVAGVRRPRIFISSGAERLLDAPERDAVLAHEAAHVEQGDLWKRILLAGCALLEAPGLSGRILARWNSATERLCDHQAALFIDDASVVASALVKLVRAQSATLATTASFGSAQQVDERVYALLNCQPIGAALSQRILRAALVVIFATLLLLAACSNPLHHLLETFLSLG